LIEVLYHENFMNNPDSWSIQGSANQEIIGNTHLPSGDPRGAVLIAHGFAGYKDYGMLPYLANFFSELGFIAHRFNFSHSGITNSYATFQRLDLFQANTYNKQVKDLNILTEAMREGHIAGGGLPYLFFGHSRGGTTVLLTAGRMAKNKDLQQPHAVISSAAPASCLNYKTEDIEKLLSQGYLESISLRTRQPLRVGKEFLTEQLEDPEGHDILKQATKIECPVLILHGSDDQTVPPEAAFKLSTAIGSNATLEITQGADHGWNTKNPMHEGAPLPPEFTSMLNTIKIFLSSIKI